MITVVPYNPHWPEMYTHEAALIKQALGNNCIEIHHIGSTAVPGLSAKPIIDILPVVKDIRQPMDLLGYQARGEYGIPFRRFFQKPGTHNVHVFEAGNPEIQRHLKFRDWMRTHPEDAAAYAQLKKNLAQKFPDDILSYVSGKEPFVNMIDCKDGYQGYRMVHALTNREWAAVYALREQHYNGNPPTLHTDATHLVFYLNEKIIGYTNIQFIARERARFHVFICNPDNEKLFLQLCHRWLNDQGIVIDGTI